MNTPNPSPTALNGNGRAANGTFAAGNKAARGNPLNRRVQALRVALVRGVTPDDFRAIVTQLVASAKGGDLAAIREVLDRVLGKPAQADVAERIEKLEALLLEIQKGRP